MILSFGFWLLVFAFFSLLYPYHLNYQEQFQLFLFSQEYFIDFLKKPGGICDYFGSFFTQFYFYSWFGAIIIATLLTFLQKVIWYILKTTGAKSSLLPISFIPSILYWCLLCNEHYLLGGLIAIILISISIWIYTTIISKSARVIFSLILLPCGYWIVGGAFLLLPIFTIIKELLDYDFKKVQLAIFASISLLLSLTIPLLSKYLFLQYPIIRVWLGVNYFRFPSTIPAIVLLIGLFIIAIPLIIRFFLKHFNKETNHLFISLLLITFVSGSFFITLYSDMQKEELMAYDFNVRMRKWDKVLEMAQKKTPTTPLSVTCLNLALAKQGLLAEHMFEYYQNGIAGLLPEFIRDYTLPMIAGEVYYHIGFINTAQRFAFESMEALPDYQKSARSIKRLAETNLINGDYQVSKKYINLLKKTFYYRKWAKTALKMMNDEQAINSHPEFGQLRSFKPDENFLFSESEKDMMLGTLFVHNSKNRLAYEYLMAYCLLSKDLQHFTQYFLLSKSLNYKSIPKSYQEALFLYWEVTNKDPQKKISYTISNNIKQRFINYAIIYNSHDDVESKLKKNYSDTYWYYIHFRN